MIFNYIRGTWLSGKSKPHRLAWASFSSAPAAHWTRLEKKRKPQGQVLFFFVKKKGQGFIGF